MRLIKNLSGAYYFQGASEIAKNDLLLSNCFLKVLIGSDYQYDCYTGIKWHDDFDYMNAGEFEYITYHYSDEERKHFFTNNCVVIEE